MNRPSLLDALKTRVLLGDGAMGTQLQNAGLESGHCGEAWNLDHPDRVLRIQRNYAEAGSDILLTNTFGACRIMLNRHGEGERTADINIGNTFTFTGHSMSPSFTSPKGLDGGPKTGERRYEPVFEP